MPWDHLRVVGAEAPFRDGVTFKPPMVRDTEGRVFLIGDIADPDPSPGTLISMEDIEDGLAGRLVPLPEAHARQGYLVVVATEKFVRTLELLADPRLRELLSRDPTQDGFYSAYAERDTVREWRRVWRRAIVALIRKHLHDLELLNPEQIEAHVLSMKKVFRQLQFLL
jgi:hypothetical protein